MGYFLKHLPADEPMSGLDSQTAWSICSLLQKLKNGGQSILCTAHQPSSQILQMFDRLLLLSDQGETLYFGDIGKDARILISYFESKGASKCEPTDNPAEWMMRAIKASPDDNDADSAQTFWARVWSTSTQNQQVLRQLEEMEKSNSECKEPTLSERQGEYASSLINQIFAVSKRTFQNYWRDPTYLYSKMALCIGVVSRTQATEVACLITLNATTVS